MLLIFVLFLCNISYSEQHGRMMEPPSRSSMWRVGFPTPKNENDNALYCGGFGVQHQHNGGRCGICGDPWDAFPRQNEAPHGLYATGIITKTYRQGSIIPVVLDITANHQGHFSFKLCPNNDIWQDPGQECFDRHVLRTGRDGSFSHPVNDYVTGLRLVYVHLPRKVSCEQCILQWTYTAGNNWGVCANGTGDLGCGPQETFRACSDIRIKSLGNKINSGMVDINSFNDETTFELDQFEDYYDELFGNNKENDNILMNEVDVDDSYYEAVTIQSVQTKKLQLLKKKLVLAKALKSLRHLIALSKEDSKKKTSKLSANEIEELTGDYDADSSVSKPWWSRTNSHGKRRRKKRRRRRFSALYDLLLN